MSRKQVDNVPGFRDVLHRAPDTLVRRALYSAGTSRCYSTIELPVVEKESLFVRTSGEDFLAAKKEMMYLDRVDEVLRPEGTAGCVRACIAAGFIHNQVRKVQYYGPMFRAERPQFNRYRQFYQHGFEIFGVPGIEAEMELFDLIHRVMEACEVPDYVIKVNDLGSPEDRGEYCKKLTDYLVPLVSQLSELDQQRLFTSPLRILDSKGAETKAILRRPDFPTMPEPRESMYRLLEMGIPVAHDPRLVRGLDYYTGVVFEVEVGGVVVCAGGRYDDLVGKLGGKSWPAVGCAFGVDRMVNAISGAWPDTVQGTQCDIYVANTGDYSKTLELAEASSESGLYVYSQMMHWPLQKQLADANSRNATTFIMWDEPQGKVRTKDMVSGDWI